MKSEVYNQSTCLVSEIAYQYYIEGKKRTEIAEEYSLSPATISRVLKRAKAEGIVEFHITEPYLECNRLERELMKRYHLQKTCVVPLPKEPLGEEEVKKLVALEGARYVQRVIQDGDILGLTWGGTMYHLIQYLNPCRKVNASIVTMHGSIVSCDEKLDVQTLVNRAAMAFGGKNLSLDEPGLYQTPEELRKMMREKKCRAIFGIYDKIDISVSGVGSCYPLPDSPLLKTDYLTKNETEMLIQKGVYSDILLHFIDKDGRECDTPIKDRTLSIDLDVYKKIPCKVIVACGAKKANSIMSLLKGKMVDVLIIDYHLAKAVI